MNIVGVEEIGRKKEPTDDAIESLLKSLRHTAGSRFNAAKRFEGRERRLTRVVAFTSVYIIILALLPYFKQLQPGLSKLIELFTVSFSLAILVASLLRNSDGDGVKAEQYHRSALEINELWRELLARRGSISMEEFLNMSERYSSILQKYSINHDDIDYLKYQLENREKFPWLNSWHARCIRLRLVRSGQLPNVFLIVISLTVATFLLWSIILR